MATWLPFRCLIAQYHDKERVVVWVNTVGPWYNPQESYPYYRLPFCAPDVVGIKKKRPSGLGEILAGNELRNSGVDIKFKGERERTRERARGSLLALAAFRVMLQ